ncbi:MAG: hypothetical protein WBO95_14285 [Candidatus Dechloromonas phosphoritropha]|jgi:(p)ppGpp synthase/HD superfamily hydrolase
MSDTLRIAQSVEFATIKHTDQRRKGASEAPYVNYLATVAANVAKATNRQDPNLIIAAYLPDCIEDCGVTKAERKSLQIEHAPHKSAWANGVACGLCDGSLALEAPALLA